MTIKIELSDAVETASGKALAIHEGYDEGWWDRIPPDSGLDLKYKTLAKIAITAALEAMVKEGTACLAYGQITSDNEGDYWTACDEWRTGDFPALIVRLGGKP